MQPRTIAGILFAIAGLSSYVSGGAVLIQGLDKQSSDAEQIRRAEISCRDQLVRIGRLTPRENDEIEILITGEGDQGLTDPRSALADATAALAMCPGREILDACIGTSCGTEAPGPIRLTMRLGIVK